MLLQTVYIWGQKLLFFPVIILNNKANFDLEYCFSMAVIEIQSYFLTDFRLCEQK